MQVLVIGQHGMCLTPKAVDVPDTQQSQQDGGVLLQGCCAEVLVLKREQGGWELSCCRGEEGGGRGSRTNYMSLASAWQRTQVSALTIQ